MVEISLSDHEVACVRLLAAKFDAGDQRILVGDLQSATKATDDELERVLVRFANFRLIDWDSTAYVLIRPRVMDLAHTIDNPEPKDHWKGVTTWFKSRWWSVPLLVVVVALPLLVQWIEMIAKLLAWMGVQDIPAH